MTLSPDSLAASFVHARETHTWITPPHCEDSYDVQGAYLVQRRFVEQYSAIGGRRPVGYKLAATNDHAQATLGVAEPLIGVLFSDDIVAAPARLDRVGFHQALAEAEVAFIVEKDLPEICSRELIVESTQVAPAIEFADSRLLGWPDEAASYSAQDIIADNGLSGRLVLGTPVPAGSVDFSRIRAQLFEGETLLSSGDVGQTPLDAVAMVGWLARTLHLLGGRMAAGTIVATGALAGPVPFADGRISVTMGDLGTVSATVGS